MPGRHETGAKTFLGTTIDSGTSASQALTQALDAICAHPNMAPFFCRQLIQRLVTSNPSPAYVARVAAVFNNDGAGARGNLREPMLRFAAWARACNATSPSGAGAMRAFHDATVELGVAQQVTMFTASDDVGQGRLLPSTSVDQYAAALGRWGLCNASSEGWRGEGNRSIPATGVLTRSTGAPYSTLTPRAGSWALKCWT